MRARMPKRLQPYLTKCSLLFVLLILVSSLKSTAFNLYDSTFFAEIERKIEENNRNKDFFASFILLQPLVDERNEDLAAKAQAKIYLSRLFKGMLDYNKAISELISAQELLKENHNARLSNMINAELALAYFDQGNYNKADSLFNLVLPQASQFLEKETEGLILLGIGSRELSKGNYTSANNIFKAAENRLLATNPCQAPLVLAKRIRLEGLRKNLQQAEQYLEEIIQIADSCSILKYKILGYEELKGAYFQSNKLDRFFKIETIVDSLMNELEKSSRLKDFKRFQNQIKYNDKEKSTQSILDKLEQYQVLFYSFLGLSILLLALILWINYFRK